MSKNAGQNKKSKKIIEIVKTVVFYMLLVFLIPVFIFSIVNKIQGNETMIGDNSVMVVASGSMSEKNKANDYLITHNLNNQFNTYDIIVLNKVKSPLELRKYDVIAYKNDEGINVIHRIISVQYENGKLTYITRGDSNNASDTYHPTYEDVIGKYSGRRIGTIGIFVIFFQSAPGIITILATIYCLVMVDYISKKVNKTQDERVKQLTELIGIMQDDVSELTIEYNEIIHYKGNAFYFNESGFIKKETHQEIIDVGNDNEESSQVPTKEE